MCAHSRQQPPFPQRVRVLRITHLLAAPTLAQVFCIPTKDVEGAVPIEGTTSVDLLQGQVTMMPYAPLRNLITSGDVLLT